MDLLAFKAKVTALPQTVDGCREWTGGRDWDGYGIVRIAGRSRRASRVAWELANGRPVPAGMVVRHSCDNPPCLESPHLMAGTVAQNNADREMRGRSDDRRGERCPTAKLTWPQVREIRSLLATGVSHGRLAARFGVSRKAVSKIAHQQTWRESLERAS